MKKTHHLILSLAAFLMMSLNLHAKEESIIYLRITASPVLIPIFSLAISGMGTSAIVSANGDEEAIQTGSKMITLAPISATQAASDPDTKLDLSPRKVQADARDYLLVGEKTELLEKVVEAVKVNPQLQKLSDEEIISLLATATIQEK